MSGKRGVSAEERESDDVPRGSVMSVDDVVDGPQEEELEGLAMNPMEGLNEEGLELDVPEDDEEGKGNGTGNGKGKGVMVIDGSEEEVEEKEGLELDVAMNEKIDRERKGKGVMVVEEPEEEGFDMGIDIPPEDQANEGLDPHDPLFYICTTDSCRGIRGIHVHAARVIDLQGNVGPVQAEFVVGRLDPELPAQMACGVFRGIIIFAGGLLLGRHPIGACSRNLYVFNTRAEIPHDRFIPMSDILTLDHFVEGKFEPFLAEVNVTVYALATGTERHFHISRFEMYDTSIFSWTRMPDPPFLDLGYTNCGFAIVGTNIMASAEESPVFAFDVTAPHLGWRRVCDRPFPFIHTALVFDLGEGADFKILFGLEPVSNEDDYEVVAYSLSNADFQLQRIQSLIQMHHEKFQGNKRRPRFCFTSLGGQKVCFTYATFSPGIDGRPEEPGKLNAFLMPFEFSVKNIHDPMSFGFEMLPYKYFTIEFPNSCEVAKLLGCFAL